MPLTLKATVRRTAGNRKWDVRTENISSDGVCFRTLESFSLGEIIEITVDMDSSLGPFSGLGWLVCVGKVVQAEADEPAAPYRYGCRILDYAFRPSGPRDASLCGAELPLLTVP